MKSRWYKDCLIINIIDGDTIDVAIDLGFYMHTIQRLRLANIDAPELRGVNKAAGKITKQYLIDNYLGATADIFTDKVGKYGRYIAEIYIDDKNLSDELVELGLAEHKEY